jgi:hypothetical protein
MRIRGVEPKGLPRKPYPRMLILPSHRRGPCHSNDTSTPRPCVYSPDTCPSAPQPWATGVHITTPAQHHLPRILHIRVSQPKDPYPSAFTSSTTGTAKDPLKRPPTLDPPTVACMSTQKAHTTLYLLSTLRYGYTYNGKTFLS